MSKRDIILIIFKCYISKMYGIVMFPNLERMYDHIGQINK